MNFSVEKYLVLGPENTNGKPVEDVVEDALKAGFTFVQIRSKAACAREIIDLCGKTADKIKMLGLEKSVPLVVDDRLDVVLACREKGIKVDGIHIGQSDIPAEICRKFLGDDAIIGLSAPTKDLIEYAKNSSSNREFSFIDYLGAGPLHETQTKTDCETDSETGKVIIKTLDEFTELAELSKIPVVVGGGVKKNDLKALKKTGVAGFFVVSAVAGASDSFVAAKELSVEWDFA